MVLGAKVRRIGWAVVAIAGTAGFFALVLAGLGSFKALRFIASESVVPAPSASNSELAAEALRNWKVPLGATEASRTAVGKAQGDPEQNDTSEAAALAERLAGVASLEEKAREKLARRGTLIGSLEGIDDERIWGFAYDWAAPEILVEVGLSVDGVLLREEIANGLREVGDAATHPARERGFVFRRPRVLDDGQEHTVRVLARRGVDDAFVQLEGSPIRIGGNRPPEGRIVGFRDGVLFGWARDFENPDEPVSVEVFRDGRRLGSWVADGTAPGEGVGPSSTAGWFEAPISPEQEPYVVQAFAVDPELPGLRRECRGSPWTVRPAKSEDEDQEGEEQKDKEDKAEEENALPFGRVAFVTTEWISGWAFDPDAGKGPIEVDVFFDGQFHGRLRADQPFPALLHDVRIQSVDHLWMVEVPPDLQDGQTHTVSVFAVNVPLGANPELAGSPATFTGKRNTEPVGFLDYASPSGLGGWAYDADAGSRPVEVEIWVDGERIAVVVADQARADLVPGAAPDPNHGWRLSGASLLDDGEFHRVRAFVRDEPGGMVHELTWSPRELNPVKPWLGLALAPSADGRGIEVLAVTQGSPADVAGVRVFDRIVAHNGEATLLDVAAFMQWVGSRSVGEKVHLQVEREQGENRVEHALHPVLGRSPRS